MYVIDIRHDCWSLAQFQFIDLFVMVRRLDACRRRPCSNCTDAQCAEVGVRDGCLEIGKKRMALISSPPFSLLIAATFHMLKVGLLSCFCPFFLGCWMDLTSSIFPPPFFLCWRRKRKRPMMSPGPLWLIDSSWEIHLKCLCRPNDVEHKISL